MSIYRDYIHITPNPPPPTNLYDSGLHLRLVTLQYSPVFHR